MTRGAAQDPEVQAAKTTAETISEGDPNGYIRVEDLDTGHQFSIVRRSFDANAYKVIAADAVDAGGSPLPAKHNPDVATRKPRAEQ